MRYRKCVHSPLGEIVISGNENGLCGLWFYGQKYFPDAVRNYEKKEDLPVFIRTEYWLNQYFSDQIPDFMPELCLEGTAFRMTVWDLLKEIPYGHTATYGEIACRIAGLQGRRSMSAQAVGNAVGHNPISIIIPCHRVIGSNGSLTGYAGGTERKKALLELEKRTLKMHSSNI